VRHFYADLDNVPFTRRGHEACQRGALRRRLAASVHRSVSACTGTRLWATCRAAGSLPIREAFLPFLRARVAHNPAKGPDYKGLEQIGEIVAAWRAEGQHFYAGFALTQAVHLAWGDGDAVVACSVEAMQEFQAAVASPHTPPLVAMAALKAWDRGARI
jgi:hypothetical protein